MSDDNSWWFFDLAVVIVLTGAATFGIFVGVDGVARIVLALPLLLVLPGYAAVSFLFPDEPTDEYNSFDEEKTGLGNPLLVTGGLEPVERFVMSIVFTVAIVPAIALFASATPGGIVPETVLSGIAICTVVLAILAIVARYRCPPENRFTPSIPSPLYSRSGPEAYGANTAPFNVMIVLAIGLLLASAGFALANPPQHDGYTEFAIDTDEIDGDTETVYEASYSAGETATLETTITNQEHEEAQYTTVVLLERVSYGDDGDATVEESEELTREGATVPDGETHTQELEFTPTMQGDDLRLTLALYDGEPPVEPTGEDAYRTVTLPIEVQ